MSAKTLTLQDAASALGTEPIANARGTQAVNDVIVAARANRRAGTHKVLTKAEVAKSGKKPWRQKGTGRARCGDKASPLWRGGGVAFGPHPRDYSKDVNKKVRKLALKKAVSARIASGDVLVVDAFPEASPKTKDFITWVREQGVAAEATVLVLTSGTHGEKIRLAARNVAWARLDTAEMVSVETVVAKDKILATPEALAAIGKRMR